MDLILREQRCKQCNKLLLRGMLFSGQVEVKCPRCKTDNVIRGIGGPANDADRYDILFDFDGRIVDVSESASRILGYSREEFLEMQRGDLHSDITPADYQGLRAVLMTGVGPVAFDTVHMKKDGELLKVRLQVRVLVSEESRFALVIGHVLRPPETKTKAEAAPYEFAVNNRGQFTYVSIPTANLLGKRWIDCIGRPMTEYVTGMAEPLSLSSHLLSGEFFQLDDVHLHAAEGANTVRVKIMFYPRKDDYGNLVGYDAVAFPLKQ